MTAEQNVYQILAATSGVTDIVSGRIYPMVDIPVNATRPYLCYERQSTDPDVTHDQHDASAAAHLDGVRFQVVAIADTLLAAINLLFQARLAVEYSMGLQAIWENEMTLPREENAPAFAQAGFFLTWKNPD